jgi:hypothetical protein
MPIERISAETLQRRRRALQTRRDAQRLQLLQWLIHFAQRDVRGLSKTAWDTVRLDLERFHHAGTRAVISEAGRADPDTTRRPARSATPLRRLRLGELRAMQRTLQRVFNGLWPAAATTTTPAADLPVQTSGIDLTRVGGGQVVSIARAAWPATVWWAVTSLLEQYGARIRRCPALRGATPCGRLFLRTRRQAFCSKTCAQRDRSRAWYGAHRAAAQQRRRDSYQRAKERPESFVTKAQAPGRRVDEGRGKSTAQKNVRRT